jgi:hypothetical protein
VRSTPGEGRQRRGPSPDRAARDLSSPERSREKPSRSRGACAFEFCCWACGRCEISLRCPPLTACFCLPSQKKEGRRNADRRVRNGRIVGCGARSAERARLSASHRGTRGSDRTPPLNSSYALPGTKRHQVLPASGLVPVQRGVPRSAGRNAGRAYPPEPPGDGVQIPPAGTAPAPPLGLPPGGVPVRERDICSRIRRTWRVKDATKQSFARCA